MQQIKLSDGKNKLITALQKTETDLDEIGLWLETEFNQAYSSTEVNPLVVSQQVKKLSRTFPEDRKNIQDLMMEKQELVDRIEQLMSENSELLTMIQDRVGQQASDENLQQEFHGFKQALLDYKKQLQLPDEQDVSGKETTNNQWMKFLLEDV
eukprot:TRINITY_DN9460_c0_g1_i2.p2 TRINITY_DN9460_c0_g1~~TRINITY_DN9460_c0_g1_i2.p2  ORF type:complete len:169 (+),score=14.52 TRINITY_DN9460_c0_g1_i2:51-509(+)